MKNWCVCMEENADMAGSVEVLIAGVNQNPQQLMEQMNIGSDAILINQCHKYEIESFEYNGHNVRVFHMAERGVGLSRNTALMRATGDICLFSDQDVVYEHEYETKILKEFGCHPEADMILFNIEVSKERRTYHNETWKKVHWYNCGRYGAVSFAVRRDALIESGITFSLLFGGGAKYSNGEDSLFIRELIKAGMRIYKSPVQIGEEIPRPSTWFTGYHEKFFFDRGVLYPFLYGAMAPIWGLRFVFTKKDEICKEIPWLKAYGILLKGIKQGRKEMKEQEPQTKQQ